jgi:undecaprenyl-diphosphatase
VIERIVDIDIEILKYVQTLSGNSIMDGFMVFLSKIGDNGFIWIALSLILIATKKHRKAGIMALSALIVSTLFGELLLKHLIGRQRPFVDHEMFNALIDISSVYSFPSGHAASSFAVAGTLSWLYKKSTSFLIALALLISVSRVYLLVHYPSDIIFGMILGLVCAVIIINIAKRFKTD